MTTMILGLCLAEAQENDGDEQETSETERWVKIEEIDVETEEMKKDLEDKPREVSKVFT